MTTFKVWNPEWDDEHHAAEYEGEDPTDAVNNFINDNDSEQWEWPDNFNVFVLSENGHFCVIEVHAVRDFVAGDPPDNGPTFSCLLEGSDASETRLFDARDARRASILYCEYLYLGSDGYRKPVESYVVTVTGPDLVPVRFAVTRKGEMFASTPTPST